MCEVSIFRLKVASALKFRELSIKNKVIALLCCCNLYEIVIYYICKTIFPFFEVCYMAVSYKKLWKLLIDHDMKKKDLCRVADVSNYTITKMTKGENVTVDTLTKICAALNCDIGDIMELIPDETKGDK